MRVTTLAVTGGTWSATADGDWIHVTPASGGARTDVRLALDPQTLTPGWHSGVLTVQEKESDLTAVVAVDFKIQQPVLKVEPNDLNYTARNDHSVFNDTLRITNEGDGPLAWTAQKENGSGWLTLADTAGTGPSTIAVRASNEGLSYFGTYRETIIVTSPGAKNSPQRIEVTLRRKRHD
ncbi:MAG: BACON domain-containing protein [Gemmatimonadales bacterium]